MTTRLPPPDKKFEFRLSVSTEEQARELDTAWREIVAGERPRTEVLERGRGCITSRALVALEIIETAIRENPTTGQARRLVGFLLGVYNVRTPQTPFLSVRA